MTRWWLLGWLVTWALPASAQGEAVVSAVSAIAPHKLRAHVRFLSHDLLARRAPGTKGSELARLYLAALLESWGFQGAGAGGSLFQPFPIVTLESRVPASWVLSGAKGRLALRFKEEFIAAAGVQQERAQLSQAELVFVGYGIQAPEYQWDDYKGADLRGKVLVFLNNDPDWEPQLFTGVRRLYYGRWTYKYEQAARLGAAGAIIVHTTPSAGYPWAVVVNSWTGPQVGLPNSGQPAVQVHAWVTEDAARKLFALADLEWEQCVAKARSRDLQPIRLGVRTSLTLTNRLSRGSGANVVGLLPGQDPQLSKELVILTADCDHLGVGTPDEQGDAMYNGAVDNAAGCAQVLAMARALAQLPGKPRRNILVAFVDGEEANLLGSAWLATHPPAPPTQLAAVINVDGGNIFGRTRDVAQVGRGKSTLDAVLEGAAAIQGRKVVDERFPDRGHFYRSDHFSFAQVGVPGFYFTSGVEFIGREPGWGEATLKEWEATRYHRPADELEAWWDFSGMVEDAQLGLLCAWALANQEQLPQWLPGGEFAPLRAHAPAHLEK